MKNSLIIGISIVIGLAIHALISKPLGIQQKKSPESTPESTETNHESEVYGDYKNRFEYETVSKFKQAAIEQLSGLKGETIRLNGEEYFYIFLVDENESGKGLTWEHNFYKFRNDSLIKIQVE